jgi:penicillin-binding protein 1A
MDPAATPHREAQRRRRGKRATRRWLLLVVLILVLASLAVVTGVAATIVAMTRGMPALAALEKRPLAQTTLVFDRSGNVIAQLHGATDRVVVGSKHIPESMKQATVAVEDRRFYTNHGVDFQSIVRAALADLRAGHIVQGGSTIAMQYVKNAYLGNQGDTLQRKVREAVLAWELENQWSKDKILSAYLNTVYYGDGAYGVQAAAETFFHERASRLTLAQAALLAGLPKDPAYYSPIYDPRNAVARRDLVLQQMQQQGYITMRQMLRAQTSPLRVYRVPRPGVVAPASYFVEYVTQQLVKRYGATRVFEGGMRVYTTLDLRWQQAAIATIKDTLNQPGDPASAVVSVDPANGQIRAMVGGLDFKKHQFNLAYQSRRQPGSAMKPFVLAAAVEQGADPATTYYVSHPLHITFPNGGPPWDVRTFDGTAYGPSNLIQATLRSDNTVYAQLVLDVGAKNVVRLAHKMGITSPLQAVPSIALGSQVVDPLELASAYATFADEGVRHAPTAITRIVLPGGQTEHVAPTRGVRVMPAGVAYVVDKILEQNVQMGTGVAAQIPGRPVAGKTGTTSSFTDAWFCGFTPNLTTVVWMGYPQNTAHSMTDVHGIQVVGGSFPAQIWHAYMVTATASLPAIDFTQPTVMPTYTPWHGKYAIGGPLAPSPSPSVAPTASGSPKPGGPPTPKPSPSTTPSPTPSPTTTP